MLEVLEIGSLKAKFQIGLTSGKGLFSSSKMTLFLLCAYLGEGRNAEWFHLDLCYLYIKL